MPIQAVLGSALLNGIMEIKARKGALSIEDIGSLFEQIAKTLHTEDETLNHFREEVGNLAMFIASAKQEIQSFTSGSDGNAGDATLHLDAVVKSTEEASNTIMDAADAIQEAAAGSGAEREQKIMEATTRIYEACNFQDLTGQRLTKVTKILNELDTRLSSMLNLFGTPEQQTTVIVGDFQDKDLLSGPQMPDKAPTQADIDALFSDIKP